MMRTMTSSLSLSSRRDHSHRRVAASSVHHHLTVAVSSAHHRLTVAAGGSSCLAQEESQSQRRVTRRHPCRHLIQHDDTGWVQDLVISQAAVAVVAAVHPVAV